jgi:phosphatidylglycerol lysyltransferase
MLQILLIVNKKIDPQLYQAGMYQPQFFGPHNV